MLRRWWLSLAIALPALAGTVQAQPASLPSKESVGLKAPDGFDVSLFATDELAHDVFCMTIDARGRVVVSGPGYVRILIDSDGDGRADSFKQFANGPKTGAQGLYFHGSDLLCTGDAGLIRYRDRNDDDVADGPPDVFLRLKTGSEHFAHSIQKGPDGWWYLMAGNMTGITDAYATLPTTPVKGVESGALLRFRPDMSAGEIVADGLRNAYDFGFHSLGDAFTYDSDGEREVSLPWYRPTRVFQLVPGSHAGWITESFKWPNRFPEMPPVIAEHGRGSPTGVACCLHRRFPVEYQGAMFVCDWTYGRVMASPLERSGSGWLSKPVSFLSAVDGFGFAPTDIEFGPDGALYVSTGGRGTRGAVFRVAPRNVNPPVDPGRNLSNVEKMAECLDADQPQSSWSRARWEPLARALGRGQFLVVVVDEAETSARRVRAIEILTEFFGGLDAETARSLTRTAAPDVRCRAAWSLGRTTTTPDVELLLPYLHDAHPAVRRFAAEAIFWFLPDAVTDRLLLALASLLGDSNVGVRHAALRVIPRLSPDQRTQLAAIKPDAAPLASVLIELGRTMRPGEVRLEAATRALDALESDAGETTKFAAVRLLQLALGDIGPSGKRPAVFDGYTSRLDLTPQERALDPVRVRLAKIFPTGVTSLDDELGRVVSALSPFNAELLDSVLDKITDDSHPVADIHWLIVSARIPVERTSSQRAKIARAFASLDPKIASRHLPQDTNWIPRITELYRRQVELDPELPAAAVQETEFGLPGHVLFLNGLPKERLSASLSRFVERSERDPDFAWTSDLIFLLSDSPVAAHRAIVRSQYGNLSVRSAVIMALAARPENQDKAKFVEGLDAAQLEVLKASVEALGSIAADRDPATLFKLVRTARRLGGEPRERPIRDAVIRLLERNTAEDFRFPFDAADGPEVAEAIARWQKYLQERFPEEAARQQSAATADWESLKSLLTQVDWSAGDPARGRALFEKRQCAQCHGGVRSVGPDLAGVTRRFSRDDLLTAIVDPNRDVSPRYQTTLVQTTSGKVHTGLVIYQSVDGLLLRTGTNQTLRIETTEIEERKTLRQSLMPAGLLKEATASDLADLDAYLRSLTP